MSSKRVESLWRSLLIGVALVLHAWTAQAHDESFGSRAPSGKFTLAVIPDTQYLFDEDRGNRAVVEKSLQWIVDHTREENIVFTVHLGDIVNNGGSARWGRAELSEASEAFRIFDRSDVQYGVVAGNHDVPSGSFDNVRGHS